MGLKEQLRGIMDTLTELFGTGGAVYVGDRPDLRKRQIRVKVEDKGRSNNSQSNQESSGPEAGE